MDYSYTAKKKNLEKFDPVRFNRINGVNTEFNKNSVHSLNLAYNDPNLV